MSDSTSNDGNQWDWGSALVGGLGGAFLSYGAARKQAMESVESTYLPAIRSAQADFRAMQRAYNQLMANYRVLEQAKLAVDAELNTYRPIFEKIAESLRAFPQVTQIQTMPDASIIDAVTLPKSSPTDSSEMLALREENEALRGLLADAQRYIIKLGGVIEPTDWPPYELPGDLLPWSTSPD